MHYCNFIKVVKNDWTVASSEDHDFTAQTKFAISAVAGPQTWLMLGAGIGLLSAAKGRRSRKA
ncbi:hypothetical protein IV454_21325 [Massilia antarctica]|uniref:PEP-CTERM sorting domain-containing protein n=1 Tax=Massilia antarctica TaxID=2765360 RepID=A0AA48WAW9_9BURK|nr:hypothetical protein [Massilia antarctica]QPI48082.1 hypothetical protein IV454_21325 [Massilia antarctica]